MNPHPAVRGPRRDRPATEGPTEAQSSEPPPAGTPTPPPAGLRLPILSAAPAARPANASLPPAVADLPTRGRRLSRINPTSDAFRRRFFPDATLAEWNDWRWQSRHRITKLAQLERWCRASRCCRSASRRIT
jgi:lysine 2,3-aminomutase